MILRLSKGIRCRIIPVIILMAQHLLLLGQMGQIKAVGKILIPTASGEKAYNAVITITHEEISIECSKRIFRLFNEFNTPLYRKLKVNTGEISKVAVSGSEKEIFIITQANFYQRYKHLFHPVERLKSVIPYYVERENAVIFIMDNPADIVSAAGKQLIKSINKKTKKEVPGER